SARLLGGPLLPSLIEALHGRTLGNPLFVCETLRSWRQDELIASTCGYWGLTNSATRPDSRSILEMIGARFRRMRTRPLELARADAVMASGASLEELRSFIEASGSEQIDDSVSHDDAGVVTRERAAFRLSHPLFQSALQASMNETRTAGWHNKILAVLQE